MTHISFLDSLIDEANDVKMLRKAGILYNCLGSDEHVAKLFNEIGTDLVPNSEIYCNVKSKNSEALQEPVDDLVGSSLSRPFQQPLGVLGFLWRIVSTCSNCHSDLVCCQIYSRTLL